MNINEVCKPLAEQSSNTKTKHEVRDTRHWGDETEQFPQVHRVEANETW